MDKSVISYSEAQVIVQEYSETHGHSGLVSDRRFLTFFIISMLITAILIVGYLHQQKQLNDLKIQEAYAICNLIDSQEEHLLLKYHVLPEHVGLGTLRDAWKDNPCYDTCIAYSDALGDVIEQLENEQKPFVPDELGAEVKV